MTRVLFILPLASSLLLAQSTGNPADSPQSWSGLLVAAACQTGTSRMDPLPRSTPTASGGQNTTYEQRQNQADRSNTSASVRERLNATDTVTTPKVDSLDTRGSAPLNGNTREMDDAAAAKNLDPSCSIGAKTSAFALRLSDDRVVRFDHAGNTRIARQLRSGGHLKHATKVFRATVKGTMQDGTIRLDSIQM